MRARLKTLGAAVASLVSARAKAWLTLAHTGRDGLRMPEVFPRSPERAQGSALALGRRLRPAQQAVTPARARLATAQTSPPGRVQTPLAPDRVEHHAAEGKRWPDVRSASRPHLPHRALLLPPWHRVDSVRQSAPAVEPRGRSAVIALATWLATHGFPAQDDTLPKVRTPLAGVSALIDVGRQRVERAGEARALRSRWQHGVDELLRPMMSWPAPRSRTRGPGQKTQRARALQAMQEECERHPCTGRRGPEVRAAWKGWAAEHAKAFQRASSAVAGRNSALAQMPPNHRGLPQRPEPVWTVLPNFACRASEGTTPASRFFRREFPDLFENV